MAATRTNYTDAEKTAIVGMVCIKIGSSDKSLEMICKEHKDVLPSAAVLRRWLIDSQDLSTVYARALLSKGSYLVEQIVEISDTEPDSQKARNRIDARKWAAAKLNPKYNEKLNIDLTASVTVQDDPASLKASLAMYHILQRLQARSGEAGEVIELPRLEAVDNSG
jgi:hypothetical protein